MLGTMGGRDVPDIVATWEEWMEDLFYVSPSLYVTVPLK